MIQVEGEGRSTSCEYRTSCAVRVSCVNKSPYPKRDESRSVAVQVDIPGYRPKSRYGTIVGRLRHRGGGSTLIVVAWSRDGRSDGTLISTFSDVPPFRLCD
jgi:hypothetical protein